MALLLHPYDSRGGALRVILEAQNQSDTAQTCQDENDNDPSCQLHDYDH